MHVDISVDLYRCIVSPVDGVRWKAWLLDIGSSNTFVEIGSERAQERALSALLFLPFGPGPLGPGLRGLELRIENFQKVKNIVSQNEIDEMWDGVEIFHPDQETLAPPPLSSPEQQHVM